MSMTGALTAASILWHAGVIEVMAGGTPGLCDLRASVRRCAFADPTASPLHRWTLWRNCFRWGGTPRSTPRTHGLCSHTTRLQSCKEDATIMIHTILSKGAKIRKSSPAK